MAGRRLFFNPLSILCVSVLMWSAACSDPPAEDTGPPCGGACPAIECIDNVCAENNNDPGDAGDDVDDPGPSSDAADVDQPDDVDPDAEPEGDAPEPEPDAADDVDPDAEDECEGDDECANGEICTGTPAVCVEGCRVPEDCPVGERCDLDAQVCAEGCDEDTDCGEEESLLGCDSETFECVLAECRVDSQCETNEFCDTGPDPNACADGCRVGGCAPEEYCDPETRDCIFGCFEDEQCAQGLYCSSEESVCVEGCRDDGECTGRRRCIEVEVEEGTRQRCARPTCAEDADCSENEYCGDDPDSDGLVCLVGCRTEPEDTCPADFLCDAQLRRCLLGCVDDDNCPEGNVCLSENGIPRCVPGCGADNQCAEDQLCIEELGRCSCEDNGQCFNEDICDNGVCSPSCEDNLDCVEGEICHPERLVCVEGCRADDECPEGQVCDLNALICIQPGCGADTECSDAQFCNLDLDPASCEEGCRDEPDNCPEGQVCDPFQRLCIGGCVFNEDCAPGAYCDLEQGCLEGCRNSDECIEGLFCDEVTVEEGVRFRCVRPVCVDDSDCDPSQFCGLDERTERQVCQLGCRVDPDNCLEGQTCNPITRSCTRPPCQNDNECGEAEVCREDTQACGAGCNQDDECSPGRDCNQEERRCGCADSVECNGEQVCGEGQCIDPCQNDLDCGDGEVCDPDSRLCVVGCSTNDDCGDGELCNQDTRVCVGRGCLFDDECEVAQFCDFERQPPRCETGCRIGQCLQGEFCDLETRRCTEGCVEDAGCLDNFYCVEELSICLEGCRGDEECGEGELCLPLDTDEGERQRCIPPSCDEDADCDDADFCGINEERQRRECEPGCRTAPDNCTLGFACNPQDRRCENTACVEDTDCGDGEICEPGDLINECQAGCRDDDDCGEGRSCDTNINQCVCFEDEECGEGQLCDGGVCVPFCGADADCDEGEVCDLRTGRCEIGCTNDDECGGVQLGFRCDRVTRTCARLTCDVDAGCPEFMFCDQNFDPGECSEGCREGNCFIGQFCDLEIRECVDGCQDDDNCFDGFFCDTEENVCVIGCRQDADCADEVLALACDVETRECVGAPCGGDDDCGAPQFCDPQTSICAFGCRLGGCEEGFFCDIEARFCNEGCSDDRDCPGDEVCDVVNHVCLVGNDCAEDADCPQGRICQQDEIGNLCVSGCRDDEGCTETSECLPDFFLCSCDTNADCFDEQACDFGICVDACTADEDCQEGLTCDLETGSCFGGGGCFDDFFEPNEDPFFATPIEAGLISDLKMCYTEPPPEGSQDCYSVIVPDGVTLRVTATFTHADGNLDLSLLQGGIVQLAEATSTDDNEVLQEDIDFGGGYTVCVIPVGDPFESEYSLNVEVIE